MKLRSPWLLFFGIIFLITLPVFADYTSVSITASDQGIGFSLIQQTASSFFAVSVGDFAPYQPRMTPVTVFPLLYLCAETNSRPSHIWQKQRGRGWGSTAKELGLPANYHGKYMSSRKKHKYNSVYIINDISFEEMMSIRFLHDYYDSDPEFLFYWHSRGMTYEDLFIAVNLGARIHRQPREFFKLRLAGHDWRFIARRYRVPYEMLSKPIISKRRLPLKFQNEYEDKKEMKKYDFDDEFDEPEKGNGRRKGRR